MHYKGTRLETEPIYSCYTHRLIVRIENLSPIRMPRSRPQSLVHRLYLLCPKENSCANQSCQENYEYYYSPQNQGQSLHGSLSRRRQWYSWLIMQRHNNLSSPNGLSEAPVFQA